MGSKLYVGNLSYNTREAELAGLFESNDFKVTSCNVIMDRDSGRSKGFGFVELGSPEEAKAAIEKLNNIELDGRALKVNEAQDKPRREGGGGGGGYRGGGGGGGRGRY
ncbi:MAG: RNA-binding protein [Planctomycetaceae bacterium]|nr:RNA-binding protein [Planctomycetaceae bacterium]